jgi:hypothetical protein
MTFHCDHFQDEVLRYAGGVFHEHRPYEAGEPGTKQYQCGIDLRNAYNASRGTVASDGVHMYALVPMEKEQYRDWKAEMEGCGCEVVDPHVYFAAVPNWHQVFMTHARCRLGEEHRCAIRKVLP